MSKRSTQSPIVLAVAALLGLLVGACDKNNDNHNGACKPSNNAALACGAYGQGDAAVDTNLTGYSCTGTARPDDSPKFIDGVPQGLVCADRGNLDDGTQGYCCTDYAADCALNPVASCSEPEPVYGYQCRGADRPEAHNPFLYCGQGTPDGDLIEYCCSSQDKWAGTSPTTSGCMLYGNRGTCDNRKMGFMCAGDTLPTEEVLSSSKSKADLNRLVCSTPSDIPNSELVYYCCYVPAEAPEEGSCINSTKVPNCESPYDDKSPFKFGFACYGPDRPEDNFPHIECDGVGVPGKSAEGYPATLYCCEYP